jgi:phage major head subunit gpT-like protein
MTVTATDVVSDDDVRALLEERTQEMYQFRRAYRDHDATGIDSGSFTFPEATDRLRGEMDEVGEGANYPRSGVNYDGVDATYIKDGFEVAVSDEAVDDSAFEVVMDVMEEMGVAAESRLDSLAFTGLDNNTNDAGAVGTDGTDLNYDAIVAGYTQLVEDEYRPAQFEVYASADGWGDLATDSQFTQATAQGEATIRDGTLDSSLGVPIYITNTGDLSDDEAHIVDTSKFGYESTRWEQEVTNYREESEDQDVFKIRHRKDFVVMDGQANVFMQGGV